MNKDNFWQFIEGAKGQCGQNMEATAQWLRGKLLGMHLEQSLKFHLIMQGYWEAADKYGLWTAATLMKGDSCSNDWFIDFRAWLIAQGKRFIWQL